MERVCEVLSVPWLWVEEFLVAFLMWTVKALVIPSPICCMVKIDGVRAV
jgi:hypothetical protein